MVYYPGRYFQICDICGFRGYNTEMRKNWKGQVVHTATCYEKKHPQLLTRAVRDSQAVKDARPEAEDVYVSTSNPVTADDL